MRSLIVLSLLLIIGIAPPAHADERLNPYDYNWETITGDGSFASSDCIGDTSDIKCLIDTVMACVVRTKLGPGDAREYDDACAPFASLYLPEHLADGLVGRAYPLPASDGWFHYFTDTYYVDPKERTRSVPQTDGGAGTINVDLFVLSCFPDERCARQAGREDKGAAQCPRTYCFGDPRIDREFGVVFPRYSLEFKAQDGRWRLIQIIDQVDVGSKPVDFHPPQQHRKR